MANSPKPPEAGFARLYAILDVDAAAARGRAPLDVAEAWLLAGVRLIQLRAKSLLMGAMLRLAGPLADACRQSGATLVINDRADVAWLAGADGVHIGQADLTPREALDVFPEARVLGCSTHTPGQLRAGVDSPATYLAFGPVFATSSKRDPDPVVGLEGLRAAAALAARAQRPLVAIGGITLETAPAAIAAGATSVAVITDLLTDDPGRRARAYLDTLASSRGTSV